MFGKLQALLEGKGDEDQPRDENGRWTDGGGSTTTEARERLAKFSEPQPGMADAGEVFGSSVEDGAADATDVDLEGGEWTEIDPSLDTIVATQDYVDKSKVTSLIDGYDGWHDQQASKEDLEAFVAGDNPDGPVMIINRGGINYVIDGHHRVAAATLLGKPLTAFVSEASRGKKEFNEDQPRDENGRWTDGSGTDAGPKGPVFRGVQPGGEGRGWYTSDRAMAETFATSVRGNRRVDGELITVDTPPLVRPLDMGDRVATSYMSIEAFAERAGTDASAIRQALRTSPNPVSQMFAEETNDVSLHHLMEDRGVQGVLRQMGYDSIRSNERTSRPGSDKPTSSATWLAFEDMGGSRSPVAGPPQEPAKPKPAKKPRKKGDEFAELLEGIKALAREEKAGRKGGARAIVEAFDWDDWAKDMRDAVEQPFTDVVMEQAERVAESLGKTFDRDDPWVKRHMTGYVGKLIKTLDGTTKAEVIDLIQRNLDEPPDGMSAGALGDMIGDLVREKFDGYADWRADTIARTETANAYNTGTLLVGKQEGIGKVLVSDGDQDDECREANGQVWDLDYAMDHLTAHPNCERAFSLLEND